MIDETKLGINPEDIQGMLSILDRNTLIGVRDYALLLLLHENSLRRQQVSAASISDFDFEQSTLKVSKKIQHQHRSRSIKLSPETNAAIQNWLDARLHAVNREKLEFDPSLDQPLFIALDRASWGHRLTGTAIYKITARTARKIGINSNKRQQMSPDRIRASAIEPTDMPKKLKIETENLRDREEALIPIEIYPEVSTPLSQSYLSRDINLIAALLADKRSINTKKAYEKDLKYFFLAAYDRLPSEELVRQFLRLERFDAIALVLKYKSAMIARNLKEATVNRRLSAIKSLVDYAGKLGHCLWNLNEVQGETVQTYRDTTGIKPAGIKAMLEVPNRETLTGKRDYAILRLLWDNALRRNEIAGTNIGDFDPDTRSLKILGKGRGSQQTSISLSQATTLAIQEWLANIESHDPNQPLFSALDSANLGHRLSGASIYGLVNKTAKQAGISKQMSPHRIRHSAITAALDATNGNVRKVQKLSRHKKLDTLMLYDDNRTNAQGEISDLLSDLI
ncbi:Integrase [Tumidithrix helvetica PCC 7403]|uniref:tyrosine-type recombinase/integrase n=1 Tax=Tumidithrix helvetica TaxID=3457545 RepID=UPI003CA9FB59